MFKFLDYNFDEKDFIATFRYTFLDHFNNPAEPIDEYNSAISTDSTNPTIPIFTETIKFQKTDKTIDYELLDRALFLSFILIGTSYYKAKPTSSIILNHNIDKNQVKLFNYVYQEGLSQYAYENNLTRDQLAHFAPNSPDESDPIPLNPGEYSGILSLQSGGKDSLLTAELLENTDHSFLYCGNIDAYPDILKHLNGDCQVIQRHIDLENLQKFGGLNGHVPVTYILTSLAIIQVILNHQSVVLLSIGREGNEPHSYINGTNPLPVNHQWSKTWEAEKLLVDYVHRYISKDLNIGSLLRKYSELKIAELFADKCWKKYGHEFSSCNVANYKQGTNNHKLRWCGNCAKCANSYLLFAPFIERAELDSLFNTVSLFQNPNLVDDFQGLLGLNGHLKPFECVGETAELQKAYHLKRPEYPDLPFSVPNPDYDYQMLSDSQSILDELIKPQTSNF